MAAVNKSLKDQGYNIDVTVTYIGWDAWTDKINMMLASGDEFELFEIAEDIVMRTEYYSRGSLTELDPLLQQYGQNILKLYTPDMLAPVSINGKVIAVPTDWLSGAMDDWFSVPKDYLDLTGKPVPKTIDELMDLLLALKKAVPGDNNYAQLRTVFNQLYLWRDFDSFPFWVDLNSIFYVSKDNEVKAYVETPEFKKTCEIMDQMYKEGLISPDVMTVGGNMDNVIKEINAGRALMYYTFYMQGFPKADDPAQIMDAVHFKLDPEKSNFQHQPYSNTLGVPSTSKHPEAGIMFLDWLYKNADNHNLFLLGIEGEDWKKGATPNTFIPTYDDKGNRTYSQQAWQFANRAFELYDEANNLHSSVAGSDVEVSDYAFTSYADKNTVRSDTFGFSFNPEPVRVEYNNVIAEMQSSMLPIKFGVVPYGEGYAGALANLKAAGLDKVVAEYDKQFQEYLASKKS
jgi:putative aldouronate transport system substrate-binding protein